MRKPYNVRPMPNASDDNKATYFAITGPDVNKFAEMDRIAKFLEAALNAATTTQRKTDPKRRTDTGA